MIALGSRPDFKTIIMGLGAQRASDDLPYGESVDNGLGQIAINKLESLGI